MRITKKLIIPLLACVFLLPQTLISADSGKSKKKSDNDFTNNISPSVYVTYVLKGSPAELAGIKTGDTISQINGHTPSNTVAAIDFIKGAGTDFSIVVADKSESRTLQIKRKEGDKLGVFMLDQLPIGQIPFGYVIKWYDGMVLDPFHGKLKLWQPRRPNSRPLLKSSQITKIKNSLRCIWPG